MKFFHHTNLASKFVREWLIIDNASLMQLWQKGDMIHVLYKLWQRTQSRREFLHQMRAQSTCTCMYVARPDRGGARVISPKWML